MRSQSGNSFAAFLMALPLLAIPLMAVFGVPQFVPVVASSATEQELDRTKPKKPVGIGESLVPTHALAAAEPEHSRLSSERLDDLFRPRNRTQSAVQSSRPINSVHENAFAANTSASTASFSRSAIQDKRPFDMFASDESAFGNVDLPTREDRASLSNRSPKNVRVSTASFQKSPATNDMSPDGLTWRQAVRRLNELGIREFRLEPGHNVGEFYFACEFSPDPNARIARRFEAEASEPLKAVAQVLRQIDEWMPRR